MTLSASIIVIVCFAFVIVLVLAMCVVVSVVLSSVCVRLPSTNDNFMQCFQSVDSALERIKHNIKYSWD